MTYRVDPVQKDELRAAVELLWRESKAKGPEHVGQMIFRDCQEKDALDWLENEKRLYLQNDDEDPSDDYFFRSSKGHRTDCSRQFLQWSDIRARELPAPTGMDTKLNEHWLASAHMAHAETVGNEPYAMLDFMGADPDVEHTGALEKLLKEGLKRVDRLGVACYTCIVRSDRALLEQYGFVAKFKVPFKAGEWGCREEFPVTMMRPAKPKVKSGGNKSGGSKSGESKK